LAQASSISAHRADLIFWGLLGIAVGMLIMPLWIGPIPPTTDFGGHAQVVHGLARLGDGPGGAWPNIWTELIERREEWWLPNLLVMRLAALMHPALDAIAALRVWSTIALVATVIGHVVCLQAFGRSRWLVFLALPVLTWNGFVGLGFINYTLGLACIPWALALARHLGVDERLRPGHVIPLGLIGVLSFFAHAFASFVLLLGVTGVLVTSARRWTRVLAGAALVPTAGLWLHWYLATRWGGAPRELHYELGQKLEAIVRESIDLLPGALEEAVLVTTVIAALFTFASGILWEPGPAPGPGRDESKPWPRRLRASTLWLLFAGLVFLYFWLPSYLDEMPTAERVIPVFVWVFFMLPRARPEVWLTRVAVGASALASVVLAVVVTRAVIEFDEQEMRPAMALMGLVPEGTRAQCVDVQFPKPVFLRRPLDHGCDGVLAVWRDAFAGGGFADTTHAAVKMREGRPEKRLFDNRWSRVAELSDIDWLIARGRHAAPAPEIAELVAWIDDPETKERRWTLYRSRLAHVPPPAYVDLRGGPGGKLQELECPPGLALAAVTVTLDKEQKLVQSVAAECSAIEATAADGALVTLDGHRVKLPVPPTAAGTSRRTLTCSGRRPIVGLALKSGLYVDAVALACGPERGAALWSAPFARRPIDVGAFRGGPGGRPNDVVCPVGMIATGLRARSGILVDALGVACRSIVDIKAARAADSL